MSTPHPYQDLEKTAVWKAIDKAVADLVQNGDLIEETARPYIVGYLTKSVLSGRLSSKRLETVRRKIREASREAELTLVQMDDA